MVDEKLLSLFALGPVLGELKDACGSTGSPRTEEGQICGKDEDVCIMICCVN